MLPAHLQDIIDVYHMHHAYIRAHIGGRTKKTNDCYLFIIECMCACA